MNKSCLARDGKMVAVNRERQHKAGGFKTGFAVFSFCDEVNRYQLMHVLFNFQKLVGKLCEANICVAIPTAAEFQNYEIHQE